MQKQEDQSEQDSSTTTSGFLQMSLKTLQAIANKGGSYKDLAAYIVLASGVSGRHGRLCTHGAKSVSDRTAMSYRAAESALEWLHENGFIHPPGVSDPKFLGNKGPVRSMVVRWVLVDEDDLDVAVCRQFLEGIKGQTSEPPLKKMLAEIDGDGHSITRGQAITDALILYAALMKEQDFGDCGGVHPTAWNEEFEPDHEEGHITKIEGADAVMVAVKESDKRAATWEFLAKVLGPRPEDEEERNLAEARFWLAAKHLRKFRLTYRVLVLWQGDPLNPKTGRNASPLATHYINDAWARKLDPHLQTEVNRAAWRTGARDAYNDMTIASEIGALPFTHTGSYRFMVRAGAEKSCNLIGQLRVRYWPQTPSTVQGRLVEKRRTEKFMAGIQSLRYAS